MSWYKFQHPKETQEPKLNKVEKVVNGNRELKKDKIEG